MADESARPRLEMLAALTDQHFLRVLAESDEPLSRAEIASRSGISKPAISDAAVRLERSGIILDAGVRGGRRGGVATLYRINGLRGHSLAIGLQSDEVVIRARDLAGEVVYDHREPIARDLGTAAVISVANRLIQDSTRSIITPLIAAAISVAVPVETTGKTLRLPSSPFPSGQFDPLWELELGAETPVAIDNDVNWATTAERNLGSMTNCDDFVYVYCGAGLGAGIYSSGRLQRGSRGLAGEIGYLRSPDGASSPGSSGSTGGLDLTEALAGLGWGEAGVYGIDVERVARLLAENPLDEKTDAALDILAIAIANMAILLNPRAIVLGGPLSALPAFVGGLDIRLQRLTLDPPDVVTSTHAPLEGASFEAHRRAREALGFS
jgi:predicted NBD/HSP70 family sugar kinase/biotin operon repressor